MKRERVVGIQENWVGNEETKKGYRDARKLDWKSEKDSSRE